MAYVSLPAQPVVDMTGIKGQYEFKLTFAPESNSNLGTGGAALGLDGTAAPVEPAPSVFDAVKQYGLRLEDAQRRAKPPSKSSS
jgi:uncharacterized protein (TIGR03435 family)